MGSDYVHLVKSRGSLQQHDMRVQENLECAENHCRTGELKNRAVSKLRARKFMAGLSFVSPTRKGQHWHQLLSIWW